MYLPFTYRYCGGVYISPDEMNICRWMPLEDPKIRGSKVPCIYEKLVLVYSLHRLLASYVFHPSLLVSEARRQAPVHLSDLTCKHRPTKILLW